MAAIPRTMIMGDRCYGNYLSFVGYNVHNIVDRIAIRTLLLLKCDADNLY